MEKKILLRRRFLLCSAVCAFVAGIPSAQAQLTKTFATQQIDHSTGAFLSNTFNVTDFVNASDGNLGTAATLNAQTTLAVLQANSFVEVGFTSDVPAGTMLYIPVQDDTAQGLLSTLAGGSLGNLLTSLVGDRSFQVQIKTATGTVVTYNSAANGTRNFAQGVFNVVKDATGQAYITFRSAPGVTYSRVRVIANTSGLVNATYQLKVQDAFYLSGTTTPCSPFLTTSFDATGLSLSLLNGSGAPVKNPANVIDTDTSNFSTFGYGTVNVGALSNISQDVFFSNLSNTGDQVKIRFSVPSSLLSLGVLNNIEVATYRNDTLVSDTSLSSVLSLEALGLLQVTLGNGLPAAVQVPVPGNVQFNRVRITFNVLAGAGVSQMLQLYGIDRVPPQPTVSNTVISHCPSTTARVSITNVTPGISYAWYNSSNVLVSTDTFLAPMAPAVGVTDTYYVTSSDCPGVASVGRVFTITGISQPVYPYRQLLTCRALSTSDWAVIKMLHHFGPPC